MFVLTQAQSSTSVVEYKLFFGSSAANRPIYRRWERETRFGKSLIVSRSEPPSVLSTLGLDRFRSADIVGWRKTAHCALRLFGRCIEKILDHCSCVQLESRTAQFMFSLLLFSTLLIPVFCVSALAYSGVTSPDLWQDAPGWRRSCIWLWWPVGIAWMRPSPWSNRPSCSASRRSRFTFLLRTLWLHSLKKGYVSCTGLLSLCSQCKGARSNVFSQRPWWQASLFSFHVYFFSESSDLWFNPARVKHSLSLCDRWYQDQSAS